MVSYQSNHRGATLVDILDKVLDKGLVVAGDIQVSLANVELLTIKVRLLVCSIDKAQEIGLDWWKHDRFLSAAGDQERAALKQRIDDLESRLRIAEGTAKGTPPGRRRSQTAQRRASRKERSE